MDTVVKEMWSTARELVAKLSAILSDISPDTLRWAGTGVVGLAAILYAYYQLREGDAGRARNLPPSAQGRQGGRADEAGKRSESSKPAQKAAMSPMEAAVHSRLQGMRCITVSCPHILLKQANAAELQEGAEMQEGVVEVLQEIAKQSEVFLLAHVEDDIGEATVQGALEAAGVLGTKPGQVPPHRLLFCSTLVGKVSIVRQLEPDLHMDGSGATVEDLKRFIPRMVQIPEPAAASVTAPNIVIAPSLRTFFALPDSSAP